MLYLPLEDCVQERLQRDTALPRRAASRGEDAPLPRKMWRVALLVWRCLLLAAPATGATAVAPSVEWATMCCGSDCAALADEYPEAWAHRNKMGKHAQYFPRVRTCALLPPLSCVRAH